MNIPLSSEDKAMLTAEGIDFDQERDYTVEEMFDLLEKIYDAEIKYSIYPIADMQAGEKADCFAHIADRIQIIIPDN